MIPKPAQYLLRFDDLCPRVASERWQRFLPLLAHYNIRPILAVIPDNQDQALNFSSPDPQFWESMRQHQAQGAVIALHGYRHLCTQRGTSLIPLHRHTEFAGVPEEIQRIWIHAGIEILRAQGLDPRVWVAPRHGFDFATLRALKAEGIGILSDGFARQPFTRYGHVWIPQQLWAPVEKPSGLWTICLHTNSASTQIFNQLEGFLQRHAAQFTTVDRVLAELPLKPLAPLEQLRASVALTRVRVRQLRKNLLSRR